MLFFFFLMVFKLIPDAGGEGDGRVSSRTHLSAAVDILNRGGFIFYFPGGGRGGGGGSTLALLGSAACHAHVAAVALRGAG